MKRIQFFDNLKIAARINMYMAGILLIIIIVMIGFYKYQINSILDKTKAKIYDDINGLIDVCNVVENNSDDGFTEDDLNALQPIFNNKTYYESGVVYLVSKSGDILIHPLQETDENNKQEIHEKRLSFIEDNGWFEYTSGFETGNKKKMQFFKYFEAYNAFIVVNLSKAEVFKELYIIRNLVTLGLILAIFVFFFGVYLILKPIIRAINNIVLSIGEMAKGKLVDKMARVSNDEIGNIATSMNILIEGLNKTAKFSDEIGSGNLDAEFTPLGEKDVLGNSLLEMRGSLKRARQEEEERKLEVEKQNWATKGLAKFADILRQENDNIEKLSFNIMSNLVNYVDANQGALFVLNDNDPGDVFYELASAIAYERVKLLDKKVRIGEALVGRVIHEKLKVYLKEIPENYINISSGMGASNPRSLLLVPLLLNDDVFGVIELASFKEFEQYQIEFIEKLGENIASTISSVRINHQTAKLLEQSQQQSEELASQEEEMRQNLEELMATQEESRRQQKDTDSLWNAINSNNQVVIYDMEEKVLEVNDRFAEVYGMSINHIVGSLCRDLGMEYWESMEEYNAFWSDLKSGISKRKTLNITTSRGELNVARTFTPILDSDGNTVKILQIGILV